MAKNSKGESWYRYQHVQGTLSKGCGNTAAANAGITTEDILKAADWSSDTVFKKVHYKPTKEVWASCAYHTEDVKASLVPRLPDLFNVAQEKRGSLVKLITCVTSGGTNFHIWHNSELAGSRGEISHRKLEFFKLKGCESASGGPSVRSPYVNNCNLHDNLIVPTSKSVPPGRGHDRVTMQIAVFNSSRKRD